MWNFDQEVFDGTCFHYLRSWLEELPVTLRYECYILKRARPFEQLNILVTFMLLSRLVVDFLKGRVYVP